MVKDGLRATILLSLFIAALVGLARPIPPASAAATVTVSTCNETSLQQAIGSANAGDSVIFGCSGTISLTNSGIYAFHITKDLTIDGTGQTVTIDGGGQTSAFFVDSNVTLTLNGLTFTNGLGGSFGFCDGCGNVNVGGVVTNQSGTVTISNSTFNNNSSNGLIGGGAILNVSGTLNVSHSTFSSNTADSDGGAILSSNGTLNVTNSTLDNNLARGAGGAIRVAAGTATITNSTFSTNTASAFHGDGSGGAIITNGTMAITNSTFSGNSAQTGGAIANSGNLTVTYSTLAGNSATFWANGILTGIRVDINLSGTGTTLIINSILANGPTTGNDGTFNYGGNCVSAGTLSVGGTYADDDTCGGTEVSTANLKLGALGDNGGPTQTIALGAGSPAIHSVLCRPDVATDQRGYARLTAGFGCTAGAYAYGATAPVLTTALSAVSGSGTFAGSAALSATLTAGGSGVSGKSVNFTLNGSNAGSATTNSGGVATLSGVSLAGINAGSYSAAITASFTGDSGYTSANGSGTLSVNKADQTISFDLSTLPAKSFGDPSFEISSYASASSGLAVSFTSTTTDVCTASGGSVTLKAGGTCTIVASQDGDTNHNPATTVSQSFNIVSLDSTPPVTTASAVTTDSAPYSFGSWTKQAVTVTLSAGDSGGAGLASTFYTVDGGSQTAYTTAIPLNTEGQHTLTYWSVDRAGNEETPHQTAEINIDTTAPSIYGTATTSTNDNGWYNQPVTIRWTCDGTETAGSCPPDQTISTEGTNQTATASATDAAGNQTTATSPAVNIDLTAPTGVTGSAGRLPNAAGWYTSPVTITFSGTGDISGIANCTSTVYSGPDDGGASVPGSCTDLAGNVSEPVHFDLKYDATAPGNVVGSAARVPDSNGWYNHAVTITFTGDDGGGAGTASCTSVTYSGPDSSAASVSGTCTDLAGNTSAPASFGLQYDATAPTGISAGYDRDPDANGWYNHAVDITFTGEDPTSGLASCTHLTYSGPDSSTATTNGSCSDAAGNQSTTASTSFKYDATAPTNVSGTADRAANASGWYTSPVTITFSGDGDISGIDSCTISTYSGPDSATASVAGSCTDNAGNISTPVGFGFQYDATAPTAVAGTADRAPDSNGWYNHAVGVTFSGDDDGSGIDNCTSGTYSGPDSATASVSGSCTDKAGNTSAPVGFGLKYDGSAPTDVAATFERDPDANGWYNHAVGISFNGNDPTSGIASCTSTTYSGPDSASASLFGTCTDEAGNQSASSSTTFKYDATAPTNVVGTPDRAPNGNGWYNAPVTFSYAGEDTTSGIGSCGPVTYSGPDSATATVSGGCTDVAGNTTTVSTAIAYDATAPVITLVSDKPSYTILQTVTIHCSISDSLSTVVSTTCAGSTTAAYTFNIGRNTVQATAIDLAGNVVSGSVTFTVTASPDDLATLTNQFVGNRTQAKRLSAPLAGIALANSLHNTHMKASFVNTYTLLVNQQRGHGLTNEEADTLIRLAKGL